MAKHDYDKEIDALAARFTSESVGSVDFGSNAKAIALGDARVRERLLALFSDGFKLIRVTAGAGYGASATRFPLVFTFRRAGAESPIELDEKSFVATVEIPTRRVKSVDERQPPQPGHDAPFSLTIPSRAPDVVTPVDDDLLGRRGRERDFLDRLSIRDLMDVLRRRPSAFEGENTAWDTAYDTGGNTNVGTETESDGIADDSSNDYEADWHLDYRVDTKHDPDAGFAILPGDPGLRRR